MKDKDKLLQKAYKDLAQPVAKQIGDILGNTAKTARFIFAPIDYLAAKQDRFQKFIKKTVDKVPEKNRVEALPQLSGPIIEAMLYNDEDSLIGELFAGLLSCAIDKTRQNKAHPAFIKRIQEISHDEAVILFYLKKSSYKVHQQWDLVGNKIKNMRTIQEDFPLDRLIYPDNLWMYIANLHSLNLAGTWKYKGDQPIRESGRQTGGYTFSERKLTDFGKLFAEACVPDNFENLT